MNYVICIIIKTSLIILQSEEKDCAWRKIQQCPFQRKYVAQPISQPHAHANTYIPFLSHTHLHTLIHTIIQCAYYYIILILAQEKKYDSHHKSVLKVVVIQVTLWLLVPLQNCYIVMSGTNNTYTKVFVLYFL